MGTRRRAAAALTAALSLALWGAALTSSQAAPSPVSTPASSTATPPGTQGWGSITPAQLAVNDAAISALVTQLSAAQAKLTAANQAAEAAEQAAALAHQQLAAAQVSEAQAAVSAKRAGVDLATAQLTLRQIAVADYLGGSSTDITILLTASDPSHLLQAEDIQTQLGQAAAAVVEQAADSKLRLDAADDIAKASAQQAAVAAAAATQAEADATAQQSTAAQLTASVSAALAQAKLTQQQDAAVLAALAGGYGITTLTPAQQAAYAKQAALAATAPLAPRTGQWSAAQGQSAVNRALSELGVDYSFAAGNAAGPTLGINSGGGGEHDGSVMGFDCSGLALFAWAPYLALPHNAAAQYSAAGSLHPSPAELLPGDLVFWSSDATVAGIHHVAIYIGGGEVIQAPESGDVVRITPMNSVDSGLFGATRPLT